MTAHMTTFDRGSRLIVGSALILAPLVSVAAPIPLALFGPYFIFTAMMKRDPAYAVLEHLTKGEKRSVRPVRFGKPSAA